MPKNMPQKRINMLSALKQADLDEQAYERARLRFKHQRESLLSTTTSRRRYSVDGFRRWRKVIIVAIVMLTSTAVAYSNRKAILSWMVSIGVVEIESRPAPKPKAKQEPISLLTKEVEPEPVKSSAPARKVASLKATKPIQAKKVSILQEQLEEFERIKKVAEQKDFDKAAGLARRFIRTYPNGSLTVDMKLLETTWLFKCRQYRLCLEAIDQLLVQKDYANKKAALIHMMGDCYKHLGNCEQASQAYRKALALGLSKDEAQLARLGLQDCSGK
jgi:tetratricopeptide (TPR) repeat protein